MMTNKMLSSLMMLTLVGSAQAWQNGTENLQFRPLDGEQESSRWQETTHGQFRPLESTPSYPEYNAQNDQPVYAPQGYGQSTSQYSSSHYDMKPYEPNASYSALVAPQTQSQYRQPEYAQPDFGHTLATPAPVYANDGAGQYRPLEQSYGSYQPQESVSVYQYEAYDDAVPPPPGPYSVPQGNDYLPSAPAAYYQEPQQYGHGSYVQQAPVTRYEQQAVYAPQHNAQTLNYAPQTYQQGNYAQDQYVPMPQASQYAPQSYAQPSYGQQYNPGVTQSYSNMSSMPMVGDMMQAMPMGNMVDQWTSGAANQINQGVMPYPQSYTASEPVQYGQTWSPQSGYSSAQPQYRPLDGQYAQDNFWQ